MRVISARFAPLPPKRAFMEPLPSAFLLPNTYTYFDFFEDLAINSKFLRSIAGQTFWPGNSRGRGYQRSSGCQRLSLPYHGPILPNHLHFWALPILSRLSLYPL